MFTELNMLYFFSWLEISTQSQEQFFRIETVKSPYIHSLSLVDIRYLWDRGDLSYRSWKNTTTSFIPWLERPIHTHILCLKCPNDQQEICSWYIFSGKLHKQFLKIYNYHLQCLCCIWIKSHLLCKFNSNSFNVSFVTSKNRYDHIDTDIFISIK